LTISGGNLGGNFRRSLPPLHPDASAAVITGEQEHHTSLVEGGLDSGQR
jgi:hypothetical protein